MRPNEFADVNSMYHLFIALQSKTIQLGPLGVHDDIEPWRRLIDDAHARWHQLQDDLIDSKVTYLLVERMNNE